LSRGTCHAGARLEPDDLQGGRDYAKQRGIIIADTKFEFGLFEGKLILIDEVLTPDPRASGRPTNTRPAAPAELRQAIRPRLSRNADVDKTPPGPKLPDDVVAKTSAKYLEAYERLTGKKL